MEALVWIGIALTLLGLAGILWCVWLAVQVRRAAASPEDARARMQRVVALNLAAFLLSALGLGAVVIGLLLR